MPTSENLLALLAGGLQGYGQKQQRGAEQERWQAEQAMRGQQLGMQERRLGMEEERLGHMMQPPTVDPNIEARMQAFQQRVQGLMADPGWAGMSVDEKIKTLNPVWLEFPDLTQQFSNFLGMQRPAAGGVSFARYKTTPHGILDSVTKEFTSWEELGVSKEDKDFRSLVVKLRTGPLAMDQADAEIEAREIMAMELKPKEPEILPPGGGDSFEDLFPGAPDSLKGGMGGGGARMPPPALRPRTAAPAESTGPYGMPGISAAPPPMRAEPAFFPGGKQPMIGAPRGFSPEQTAMEAFAQKEAAEETLQMVPMTDAQIRELQQQWRKMKREGR